MKNVVGNLTYDRPCTSSKKRFRNTFICSQQNGRGCPVADQNPIAWMDVASNTPSCFAVCKLLGEFLLWTWFLFRWRGEINLVVIHQRILIKWRRPGSSQGTDQQPIKGNYAKGIKLPFTSGGEWHKIFSQVSNI